MYRQSVAAKFNSTASGKIPENSIAEFALRGGSGERGAVALVPSASAFVFPAGNERTAMSEAREGGRKGSRRRGEATT